MTIAAPLLLLGAMALGTATDGVPPVRWPTEGASFEAARALLEEPDYARAALRSLSLAAGVGALCVALAYPMALGLQAAPRRWRLPLLGLLVLPFWVGALPRLAAWIGLLRDSGWIPGLLRGAGIDPPPLLYTELALALGLVHAYLPFAVLPLHAQLARLDPLLVQAATDLGAGRWTAFRTVTLPLSLPGAAAAFLLVAIPCAGEFVVPELLGPPGAPLIGRLVWTEFFTTRDWPRAAALALALLLLLLPGLLLFQRLGRVA